MSARPLDEVAESAVAQAAGVMMKRSAWARAVPEDLRQEGRLAVEKARASYDPAKGDWRGYAYRAAWLHLAAYVVAEASPVTRRQRGGANPFRRAMSGDVLITFPMASRGPKSSADANTASGAGHAALESDTKSPAAFHGLMDGTFTPATVGEDLEELDWNAKVRARVLVITRGDADVARIVLEETTPAEVAARTGVPVSKVYARRYAATVRMAADVQLQRLLREKTGHAVGKNPKP